MKDLAPMFVGIFTAAFISQFLVETRMEKEAVRRGYGYYDQHNQFKWKEEVAK